MAQLRPWLNAFASLVDIHVPVVGRRLRLHAIEPEMYFLNWVMTMFTQVLGLDLAAHAWDCFVLGGDSFIFRIAFAILRLLEAELADADYEMLMTVLTAPLPAIHDDAALFTTIYAFELSEESFRSACRDAGCDC